MRFDSVEGVGGDGLIGLFGADYERGPLLAGVALSRGAGEGAWTAGGRYGMDAALTGVHPYLRLALTDRFSVWSALGYGAGEMTVTDEGGDGPPRGWRTGIGMSILALGAGGALLEPEEAGGFALSARSDAYLVRIESGAVSAPRCATRHPVLRWRRGLGATPGRTAGTGGGTRRCSCTVIQDPCGAPAGAVRPSGQLTETVKGRVSQADPGLTPRN